MWCYSDKLFHEQGINPQFIKQIWNNHDDSTKFTPEIKNHKLIKWSILIKKSISISIPISDLIEWIGAREEYFISKMNNSHLSEDIKHRKNTKSGFRASTSLVGTQFKYAGILSVHQSISRQARLKAPLLVESVNFLLNSPIINGTLSFCSMHLCWLSRCETLS